MSDEERIHAGDGKESPSMADVSAEDERALEHAEHLLNEDYETSEPATHDTESDSDIDVDDAHEAWTPPENKALVEPHIHEIEAQLLWDTNGLDPYWDLADAFDRVDRHDEITFEFAGEDWRFWYEADGPDEGQSEDTAGCRSWQSGLAHPDDPAEPLDEFQLVVVQDDELHERRATLQFRPAVPDAVKAETGEPVEGIPDALPEGIRVQVAPTENVDPHEVEPLIRATVQALGLDERYFPVGETHEWSRATGLGQYLRIRRSVSEEKIVPRNGILERVAMFSSVRPGKGKFEWDNEEIVGHWNTVDLDVSAAEKLLPSQTVAKRLKSYHTAQPTAEEDPDEPTTSPKLEVQWQKELSSTTAVPWRSDEEADIRDLVDEFDEFLLNLCSWAGLPTGADENVYVADEYNEVTESVRDVELVQNPLPELKEREQDLVLAHIQSADPSQGERAVLEALAESGDGQHWQEIAEESGTSKSTVYRAKEAFDPIIRVVNGVVSFEDDVIRSKAESLLETAANAVERVTEGLEKLAAGASQAVDPDSALGRWARTYDAIIEETLGGMEIELTGTYTYRQILHALRRGYDAARATGRHVADEFMQARFVWHDVQDGRVERRPIISDNAQVRILGEAYTADV